MSRSATAAQLWINRLQLASHPEGGYYRQTYMADANFDLPCLPPGFTGRRAASTAIYYLLEAGDFSAFHRIRSDELWHFYAGDALEVITINAKGAIDSIVLGSEPAQEHQLQAVVKAGLWFASRLVQGGSFALVGCTVSPGFHFDDFELGRREKLAAAYPQHRQLIEQLTRM